jgi:membrane-bound serine protease (ClpP class)
MHRLSQARRDGGDGEEYASWMQLARLLAVALMALLAHTATWAAAAPVYLVDVDGAIGPATAEHVDRALQRAAGARAQLVVIRMDTPGGLDRAMRDIIKAMLASPVPIAVYVAPSGARAASAGTYILYASHIAAMAPATNLGAATPVAMGMPLPGRETRPAVPASGAGPAHEDTMRAKHVNDAAAFIRGLAQLRGRDQAWADQAVREAVSLPASDALARKVIDVIAADMPDLLRKLDGRVITMHEGASVKLATRDATVVTVETDWRGRLLAVISDPNVALMLLMVGVYGLLFEFMSPGFMLPGVVGGICLLMAMWGLQMLPVNYAGLALVLLGISFFVAEAFVPSHGALGVGGVAAFAFGAVLLIDSEVPGLRVAPSVIAAISVLSLAGVIGIAAMAAKAHGRPVVSGAATLLGASGDVVECDGNQGWAEIAGERWRVKAAQPLHRGQRVTVAARDGLALQVRPQDGQPT